MWLLKVGKD
uniref:Uncharacterized protein n=1 Tax=Rhizophora mucronata TaxID=61149 RepID=A0A2P2NLP8_RHIMU